MGGIFSCLTQAREDGLDGLFFAPCDVPLYNAEAIEKLAEHIGPETDAAIWKTGDGRLQMTFAYYSVGLIPTLEALINAGRYSMKACLDTANVRIVDADDAGIDEKIFVNINEPEDYNRLQHNE
jgi:molybdopterin-guanine dinucleotide biosynthesis protein A